MNFLLVPDFVAADAHSSLGEYSYLNLPQIISRSNPYNL